MIGSNLLLMEFLIRVVVMVLEPNGWREYVENIIIAVELSFWVESEYSHHVRLKASIRWRSYRATDTATVYRR